MSVINVLGLWVVSVLFYIIPFVFREYVQNKHCPKLPLIRVDQCLLSPVSNDIKHILLLPVLN